MYRVLLPIDNDEDQAEKQIDALLSLPINKNEVSATVLHVFEEIDAVPDEAGPTVIENLNESLSKIRDIPDTVDHAQQRLEEDNIRTERIEVVGKPVDSILQIANEIDADMIVVSGRDQTPVGKAVFGSIAQSIVLEGDQSVLICD